MKHAKKSTVIGMRIRPDQEKKLKRLARRLGRTVSDAGALLVEEGLRRSEFAFIDFRDSAMGREAYIQGHRLPVWQVIKLHNEIGGKVEKTAEYLSWSPLLVQAALNYVKEFPMEIQEAIAESEEVNFNSLLKLLPGLERVPFLEDVPEK